MTVEMEHPLAEMLGTDHASDLGGLCIFAIFHYTWWDILSMDPKSGHDIFIYVLYIRAHSLRVILYNIFSVPIFDWPVKQSQVWKPPFVYHIEAQF